MSALAAVALAEPEPHYGYYGYPYHHQLQWPSVRAPGFSSTCWGCRGKRSAEVDNVNRVSGASPFPSYTAAWPGATVSVNHMGKRSADAEPEADADAYYGYYGYGGHGYALPGHRFVYNCLFTIFCLHFLFTIFDTIFCCQLFVMKKN